VRHSKEVQILPPGKPFWNTVRMFCILEILNIEELLEKNDIPLKFSLFSRKTEGELSVFVVFFLYL
jgi:hypothetical protein